MRRFAPALVMAALFAGSAQAEIASDKVRIGVLTDLSGIYESGAGNGSVGRSITHPKLCKRDTLDSTKTLLAFLRDAAPRARVVFPSSAAVYGATEDVPLAEDRKLAPVSPYGEHKKLAEEAVEVVIDAMQGDREAVVRESADLLYHLVVLWAEGGIRPQEVWAEMDRREKLMGLAEKLPKESSRDPSKDPSKDPTKPHPKAGAADRPDPRKVVALEARRIPKRRRPGY